MSKKEQPKQKEQTVGITVKKADDSGEWYSQVLTKADLIDYTDVSGCYIYKPASYSIWEKVQVFMNKHFAALGVKNSYFPLFIPEKLLQTEAKHVAGFTPEVAWVTHSGETKLAERLAIRPTSETIMYAAYKKWIRSHRDLPLLLNQWNNVVRWEFKNPVPFIRAREFLWQEGHTAHKNKEDALKEVLTILDIYEQTYRELYAIPVIKGVKTDSEKFAGADMTTTLEIFLPSGKAIQGCTSHFLGQNFSKAFDITFLDEKEQRSNIWQNSWGYSIRSIGAMILMHGDDKGLVMPPAVAPVHVVIVPIIFDDTKTKVLAACEKIKKELEKDGHVVHLDDRDECSAGWKFNEWELKGIPLRIEVGPKDIDKQQAVLVRRDTGKKEFVKLKDLDVAVTKTLHDIQLNLYETARTFLKNSIVMAKTASELKKAIDAKKMVECSWCGSAACEEKFGKESAAKILCIPYIDNDSSKGTIPAQGNCALCGKAGKHAVYVGRSY
ncbi:MAG: proline--tRNA ligase [Candidatus Woesearchaeota archaeon]|nr:proline--tRNA ligase [Candidatus Woesearchaeota archaeon]